METPNSQRNFKKFNKEWLRNESASYLHLLSSLKKCSHSAPENDKNVVSS